MPTCCLAPRCRCRPTPGVVFVPREGDEAEPAKRGGSVIKRRASFVRSSGRTSSAAADTTAANSGEAVSAPGFRFSIPLSYLGSERRIKRRTKRRVALPCQCNRQLTSDRKRLFNIPAPHVDLAMHVGGTCVSFWIGSSREEAQASLAGSPCSTTWEPSPPPTMLLPTQVAVCFACAHFSISNFVSADGFGWAGELVRATRCTRI
jgi:hypothetical protein